MISIAKVSIKIELNVASESITEGFWHLTVAISELPILKISNAIDFHSLLGFFVRITSGIVQFLQLTSPKYDDFCSLAKWKSLMCKIDMVSNGLFYKSLIWTLLSQ